MKHIIFIPSNGKFKRQDYSLHRIAMWLSTYKTIKTTLLYIKSDNSHPNTKIFDTTIELSSQEEIFKKLEEIPHDIIFNRSWMHAYPFSKKLVKKFDNVVINIKDWNFSSKKEYKFLFNDSSDFKAINYIFKNAKYIFSHFTYEQAEIWAEKYKVDKSKFIFFPEYCNQYALIHKDISYENIKIAYAGRIHKSSYPEQLFPAKSHLRSITKLTKQKIKIDFILPEKEYDQMQKNKYLFLDFLYEDRFNKRFNLLKGKSLNPEVLRDYHFGFFELETSGYNKSLYRYAITSKFAFYLESCTPMLVNKDFVSIANIVSTYNLGIVFSNDDLDNFTDILQITQEEYNQYIKNIINYRKQFTYESNHDILDQVFVV